MTRRSDALQALVSEIVSIEADIVTATQQEDAARAEFVTARQALDARVAASKALDARENATLKALDIIRDRDSVSEETVAALMDRARA